VGTPEIAELMVMSSITARDQWKAIQDGIPGWGGVRQGYEGFKTTLAGFAFTLRPNTFSLPDGKAHLGFKTGVLTSEEEHAKAARDSLIRMKHGAALHNVGFQSAVAGLASMGAAWFNLRQAWLLGHDVIHSGVTAIQPHAHGVEEAFVLSYATSLAATHVRKNAGAVLKQIFEDVKKLEPSISGRGGKKNAVTRVHERTRS
jgi:hypothetical protein